MHEATDPPGAFVGRERELAALRRAFEHAVDGRGRLVLLAGEPGIGKTRTSAELTRLARECGACTLWGACYDGEWSPSFGPFAEALTTYARSAEPDSLCSDLGFGAAALARVAPAIRERLPDLPEPVALQPDEERFRVLDAVAQFLIALARRGPLVLVLDDLHWADRGTCALLRHVARFAPQHRLLLVGTYRDAEIAPSHPLAEALGALYRETTCERIALQGLEPSAVAELVGQSALPDELSCDVARAISSATNGNPFFVREVLQHLGEASCAIGGSSDGIAIPDSVRQVLGHRVRRLPEETRRLLSVAAALGSPFHLGVAARVAELGEDAALVALDGALASQLVRPADGADRYDFTHALVRETLYGESSPSRQLRRHRQIAEAMEALWADRAVEHAAEIAQQYHRSRGLPGSDRGVPHAIAGADRAATAYARDEEATFLRLAVDLLPEGDARRPSLLARLGRALAWTADGAAAAESASEAARSIAATDGAWAAADYVASVLAALYEQGFMDAAFALARQGLEHCGDRRDPTWASIRAIDLLRMEAEEPNAASVGLDTPERRELARYCGDRFTAPEHLRQFFIFPSRAALDAAYPAERRDERFTEVLLGDFRRAVVLYRERAERHEREGRIARAAEYWYGTFRLRTALGDLAAARAARERCFALAARLPGPSAITAYIESGEHEWRMTLDEGWGAPIPGVPAQRDGAVARLNRWHRQVGRALVHARLGRVGQALERLASAMPAIERGCARDLSSLAYSAAETLWLTGRSDFAAAIERSLREKVQPADFREPLSDWRSSLGRICALQGRHEEASRWFTEARVFFDERGERPLRAVVDHDEGLMYVRRGAPGDRERAAPLLEAALREFRAIGMPGWIRRAERLLCEVREASPEASPTPERARAEPSSAAHVFRQEGEYWTIAFDGALFRLRDTKGLRYLATLLRHPGREFHVLQLASETYALGEGPPPGSAWSQIRSAPLGQLDATACAAYKARLARLRDDLEEAEARNDLGRAEQAQAEIEFLAEHLAAATGLGGRTRAAPSDAERARQAVTKRIKDAIRRIDAECRPLARHLSAAVVTGLFCSYDPIERTISWLG